MFPRPPPPFAASVQICHATFTSLAPNKRYDFTISSNVSVSGVNTSYITSAAQVAGGRYSFISTAIPSGRFNDGYNPSYPLHYVLARRMGWGRKHRCRARVNLTSSPPDQMADVGQTCACRSTAQPGVDTSLRPPVGSRLTHAAADNSSLTAQYVAQYAASVGGVSVVRVVTVACNGAPRPDGARRRFCMKATCVSNLSSTMRGTDASWVFSTPSFSTPVRGAGRTRVRRTTQADALR